MKIELNLTENEVCILLNLLDDTVNKLIDKGLYSWEEYDVILYKLSDAVKK